MHRLNVQETTQLVTSASNLAVHRGCKLLLLPLQEAMDGRQCQPALQTSRKSTLLKGTALAVLLVATACGSPRSAAADAVARAVASASPPTAVLSPSQSRAKASYSRNTPLSTMITLPVEDFQHSRSAIRTTNRASNLGGPPAPKVISIPAEDAIFATMSIPASRFPSAGSQWLQRSLQQAKNHPSAQYALAATALMAALVAVIQQIVLAAAARSKLRASLMHQSDIRTFMRDITGYITDGQPPQTAAVPICAASAIKVRTGGGGGVCACRLAASLTGLAVIWLLVNSFRLKTSFDSFNELVLTQ